MKACKKLRNFKRNAVKPWQHGVGILRFPVYTETLIIVELFPSMLCSSFCTFLVKQKTVDDDD